MAIYFQKFNLPEKDGGGRKHEKEHQAGLNLLKEVLSRDCQLSFSGIESELSVDSRGKPFFVKYPQIYFNISHGRDMVVCGVDSASLGVDVEAIRPVKSAMFRRVLTKREQDKLEKSRMKDGEGVWYRDFFRLWTLKESYVKAVGIGLALDFTRLEFNLEPWEEKPGDELAVGGEMVKLGLLEQGSECRFRMREVGGRLDGEIGPWRFFQTIIEQEYVISCCLSCQGSKILRRVK